MQRVSIHGQYIMARRSSARTAACRVHGAKTLHHGASGTEALLDFADGSRSETRREVITTPFTFAATAEMICCSAACRVVDIEPDTCNIDASADRSRDHGTNGAVMRSACTPVRRHGHDQRRRIATRNCRHRRAGRASGRATRPQELQPEHVRSPASFRASRSAVTATAARSSRTTMGSRRRAARFACTGKAALCA